MIRHTLPLVLLASFALSCGGKQANDSSVTHDSSASPPEARTPATAPAFDQPSLDPAGPAGLRGIEPCRTFLDHAPSLGEHQGPRPFGGASCTTFEPAGAQDIQTCRRCKDAAMSNDVEVWNELCRSLTDKAARARCWEQAHESKPKKSNWCQDEFCN